MAAEHLIARALDCCTVLSQVVGLLLRARKYNLVEFEGETLFQGQNDFTPIFLVRSEKTSLYSRNIQRP
jgi:hypothetical protein